MLKLKLVQMIAVFIFVLLISLLTGRGLVKTEIHDSGNAQYMHGYYCMVDNTVKQDEYIALIDWCKTKYLDKANK